MANGDVAPDMSQNGLDLMGILKALSVAPKTPPETAALNPKQFSVAPQTPQRSTLDTSAPPRAAAEPKAPQQPEDQTQKMMEMFNAILGQVPKVNVPTNRRPSDWIMGAVAPLATGLATAMSGPRYKAGRNFVAGLASTAPQAVAGLIDAPAQRRLQQQELNQKRFTEAGNILRSFSPFLRSPQGMRQVYHPETGETTWEYNANAAGGDVTPKSQPQKWETDPNDDKQEYLIETGPNGKATRVIGPDNQPIKRQSKVGSAISIAQNVTPIKQTAQGAKLKAGDFVYDAEKKVYGRTEVNQQGIVDHVNWDDGQGHPIIPPPGYLPTNTTTVDVRPVTDADGNSALMAIPIQRTESKQLPSGTGAKKTPFLSNKPQAKAGVGSSQSKTPPNAGGIRTLVNLGQKQTKAVNDTYSAQQTNDAITGAKSYLKKDASNDEIAKEAKSLVEDAITQANKRLKADPNDAAAKRLLQNSKGIYAAIDKQLGTQKGMTLTLPTGPSDDQQPAQ